MGTAIYRKNAKAEKYNYQRAWKKKPGFDRPYSSIALKLLLTHEQRKKDVEAMMFDLEDLAGIQAGPGTDVDKIKMSRKISDPTGERAMKVADLKAKIHDEQRRIDAVNSAILHLGDWETDKEVRLQIKKCIINACKDNVSYYKLDYPEEYDEREFRDHRRTFLNNILRHLNLLPYLHDK